MKKKILVFAAHPDDELLGLGGTLIKHVSQGDEVSVIIFTTGVTSRDIDNKDIQIKKLRKNLINVSKFLKFKKIFYLGLNDQKLDEYPIIEIIKKIESIKKTINPDIIYTHHYSDLNKDHRVSTESVMVAFRPDKKKYKIIMYETPSSSEYAYKNYFTPNYYVDIKKTYKKKVSALYKYYKSEMKTKNHPRSKSYLLALAKKRGGECGLEYAEAFFMFRDYN